MTSTKPSTAYPELVPLLDQFGLTWAQFSRKGRLPANMHWIAERRRDVITALHRMGMSWVRMQEVTGLSLGAIERGTRATWNEASRKNRQENAARVGRAGKGRKKPWLAERLRQDWAAGMFDFHRGRIRSLEEREVLRLAASRPEVRKRRHDAALRRWQNPAFREPLLAYHRSEENRLRLSRAQTQRMQEHPEKWCRGRGAWLEPKKCSRARIWTRSSYERVVARLLDASPEVESYVFEPRVELPDGHWILPDFVVRYTDRSVALIEVKASWVLTLPPEHKVQQRLRAASTFALAQGWAFLVWTEKDFGDARNDTAGENSSSLQGGLPSSAIL